MNYRHAYHAGNFADCFKHSMLVMLVGALTHKSAPCFILDTHAGAGGYDLDAEAARRTGEAWAGIRVLLQRPSPALAPYLGLVEQIGLYPGSPVLIRALLRENDRLDCCELVPEDATTLRRRLRGDRRVGIHNLCGWEALDALLPPREKRGLVFIDPPFEAPNEFLMLADGLHRGHRRFSHGMFAAWYPIKQVAAVRSFHSCLTQSGIRDIVAIELRLRDTASPGRLNGCGLVVINPPHRFEDQAESIANAVLNGLGGSGTGTAIVRLRDE